MEEPSAIENGKEYFSDEDIKDGRDNQKDYFSEGDNEGDPLKFIDLNSTKNNLKKIPNKYGTDSAYAGFNKSSDNETKFNDQIDEKNDMTVKRNARLCSPASQQQHEQFYR